MKTRKRFFFFLILLSVVSIQTACAEKPKKIFHFRFSKSVAICLNALNNASRDVTTKIITFNEGLRVSEAENAEIDRIYGVLNAVDGSEHGEPDGSIIELEVYNFIYSNKWSITNKLEILLYYLQRFESAAGKIYLPIAHGAYVSKRDGVDHQPLFQIPLFGDDFIGNDGTRQMVELKDIEVPIAADNYVREALKVIREMYFRRKLDDGYWKSNYRFELRQMNRKFWLELKRTREKRIGY